MHAFHSSGGATYHKPFGDLAYPAAHWVVVQGDEVYGVSIAAFESSYEPVADRPHTFRKVREVWAHQMESGFTVDSPEGVLHGQPGDWLVQNVDQHGQWLIPKDSFTELYDRV